MSVDRDEIRRFVSGLLDNKGANGELADDAPLLSSGRLDSIDVLEIVAFLETRYGIDFAERAFDPGDFDTIDSIAKLAGLARPGS